MRTAVVMMLTLLVPAAVSAQPRAFAVSERPAAGVFIGPSINGDRNGGDTGADLGFVFDTPVVYGTRLRADVSRASWQFEQRDWTGALMAADTVTLESVRVSVIGVRPLSARAAAYAGFGGGLYGYRYSAHPLRHPWRGGANAVAGVEILSPGKRFAFDAEVRTHAVNGAGQPPVFSALLFKGDAALGIKLRF